MKGRALDGRRALITGAAGGIGRAVARRFAAEGARCILADIDRKGLAEIRDELRAGGAEAHGVRMDVSERSAVVDLMRETAERIGGLDILVNNAGIQRVGLLAQFSERDWDDLLRVNVTSCFLCVKYATPLLEKSGGTIVNVASLDGLKGGRGNVAYSASKGAVIGLTRALAGEVAPLNIRVNALCPGWIDNGFNRPTSAFLGGTDVQDEIVRRTVPLGRYGSNEEAADAVFFLASDASSYMTGQALVVDGGLY